MDLFSIALLLAISLLALWLFAPRTNRDIPQRKQPSEIISVSSRIVLEVRIHQMSCAYCDGTLRLENVEGEVVEGEHLRLAHVQCVEHGHQDILAFRLEDEPTS